MYTYTAATTIEDRSPGATQVPKDAVVDFQHPSRPNQGQMGKPIWLKANYFKVEIPNSDIHQYDIDIKPDKCPRRLKRFLLLFSWITNRSL